MEKRLRRVLSFLLSLALVVTSVSAFGVTKETKKAEAATFTDLNQEAIVEAMGAGWNLGNQLEANSNGTPSETVWGNPLVSENLIKLVKSAGFKTIRIPVSYLSMITYNSSTGNYEINSDWLDRVQEVVDYCVNNDMYAIINMHGDGYTTITGGWLLCNSSDQTTIKKKYADCWKQIATKFKDYDEHLIFESMNEEFDGSYNTPNTTYYSNINAYNQIFVDTVRQTGSNNAKRWLLIPGWNTNIDYTVGDYGFSLPTDNYRDSSISENRIMISVHYYDPWEFAGAGTATQWGDNATSNYASWGDKSYMSGQFDKLYSTFVTKGYPVVIGEYGATDSSSSDSKNLTCRKDYYKTLCQQAYAKGCIPVAWDNNGHGNSNGDQFGLFDRYTLAATTSGQEIIDSIMEVYNAASSCTSTDISLNKSSLTIKIGETETLTASLTPSTSTDTVTWTSSDIDVAKVYDGTITPVAVGSCTITAKTANGNKATCEVTVEAASEVKLQVYLMNSSDWSTASSGTEVISSSGGTYTFELTASQTALSNIASFYVKDVNMDSTTKYSAFDSCVITLKSCTINGTNCPINSLYTTDTFTYDKTITTDAEFARPKIDFGFINAWNNVTSLFTTTYQVGTYAYAFNNVSLSSTNTVSVTIEVSDVNGGEEEEVVTDQDAADAVIDLINAIGTVAYPDSEDAIVAAEEAYAALTDTQKALVTNYATLTAARTSYEELEAEAADIEAADEVNTLINA
ncbi:MAG: cellulase family glycosylhydrolase, partial [Lachnospiraceae bacterium]|nr:cellulase family glycosylhydrolase [Lachnospiraceae bacterium]